MRRLYGCAFALSSVLVLSPLHAADMPRKAALAPPAPVAATRFDWSGFYLGGHIGYGAGTAHHTTIDPTPLTGRNDIGSAIGGVQLGYNRAFASGLLLGVEADLSFFNYLEMNPVLAEVATPSGDDILHQIDMLGTVRGRVGYAYGPVMLYGTGGLAFAPGRIVNGFAAADSEKKLYWRTGWAAGAGAEYAFAPLWTTRLEYLHYDFDTADMTLRSGARRLSSFDFDTVRIGVNRQLGWPGGPQPKPDWDTPLGGERWELHAQTTYIQQGYPAFHAPYSGDLSLPPWATTRNTWSMSAFAAVRLWQGGELYVTPEMLQGYGLHDGTGLAGFSNGESVQMPLPYPRVNATHLFVRQVFGFGGAQEKFESAPYQLSGTYDVSRLTIQAGKFAVLDVFDGNTYAKDPRKDFMNWAIWAAGAFDYAADRVGLTYGVTAELNQKSWALRAGYFIVNPDSSQDIALVRRGGYVVELEERWSAFEQPGKLRLLGFLNSVRSGSYRETLDDPALDLDIGRTRRDRIKYGFAVNLEQAVSEDLGVFGRLSWNDGKNEIMGFTDIDASASFGASIKGTRWGRKDDTIGIGAAVNGLSRDHRDFLAAGGLGVQVGDGALDYATERIIEAYYSIGVLPGTSVTLDYQHVANPGYNADRGPVDIFSARLHAEF